MVYIIIKTGKNLESELQSIHQTKEDASHYLTRLANRRYINRILNGSVLKVYENNYLMRNQTLYLYQIIKVDETPEKKTTNGDRDGAD